MHARKNLLIVAGLLLAAALPLSAGGEVVILDYHTFLGNHKSALDYTPEVLASQMDAIAALGYKFVSLDDAIAGRIEGKANVVITVDDGHRTVWDAYEDVFEARSIRPELFVYPGPLLSGDKHFLSVERLAILAAKGCGIGAHGYYHEYMTEKAYQQNRRKVEVEARRPAAALEKLFGSRPSLFAYPFGVTCQKVEDILKAEGYSWAFLAGEKVKAVDFSDPGLDHFAVPRTIVYHWNRDAILKALADRLRS
jgi:peptidoglycan/xylan/chitin deacetylase (PgdA/CDA1 family)